MDNFSPTSTLMDLQEAGNCPKLGHLGHPLGLRLILGQKVLNKSRFPVINGLLRQGHDPLVPQGGRKWPKVGYLGHPLALGIILGPKVLNKFSFPMK